MFDNYTSLLAFAILQFNCGIKRKLRAELPNFHDVWNENASVAGDEKMAANASAVATTLHHLHTLHTTLFQS
jgi:hypothetical protein